MHYTHIDICVQNNKKIYVKEKVKYCISRSFVVKNQLPQNVGSIIMQLKCPNGELSVAVDHNQLRTMGSETVDPIDWPLLPTLHRAVPLELHLLHGENAGYESQALLQTVRLELATFGMLGQLITSAAIQGYI